MIDVKKPLPRKIMIIIEDDGGKGTQTQINIVGYNPVEAIGQIEMIKTIMLNNIIKDGQSSQVEIKGKKDDFDSLDDINEK
jgi:hypothetical protein